MKNRTTYVQGPGPSLVGQKRGKKKGAREGNTKKISNKWKENPGGTLNLKGPKSGEKKEGDTNLNEPDGALKIEKPCFFLKATQIKGHKRCEPITPAKRSPTDYGKKGEGGRVNFVFEKKHWSI